MPKARDADLVAIQSTLHQLRDLLKDCLLICLGPKHAVKGEVLLLALGEQLH
jgi:hypothetical protein